MKKMPPNTAWLTGTLNNRPSSSFQSKIYPQNITTHMAAVNFLLCLIYERNTSCFKVP